MLGDDFVFIRMQPRELDASAAFEADFAEDERLERQVRWGILVIAGLILAIWLRS